MRSFFTLLLLIPSIILSQVIVGESDSLEYRKGKIIYKGNVKLTKDGGILLADEVEVFVDEAGKPKKLVAKGKVRYLQEGKRAQADYAQYDLEQETLLLKGNAKIEDGGNLLEADIIIYNRKTDTLEAKSVSRQVRTLYIEEERSGE